MESSIKSPLIKLKQESEINEEMNENRVKKPFDRNEYMRNYMREYMRKKSQQQKQAKVNEQQIMRKAVELLIDIVNVYTDSLSKEQLERINNVCDTKTYDISFILESLTDEIREADLF